MIWDTTYDRLISWGAWFNVVLYAGPALILLTAFNYFELDDQYLIPALLIYFIGALAHMLGHGFQALNAQIKVSIDYAVRETSTNTKA